MRPLRLMIAAALCAAAPTALMAQAAPAASALQTHGSVAFTLPDATATAALANRYAHPNLGSLTDMKAGKELTFDFGTLSTVMATKRETDGSLSFITASPDIAGLPVVPGKAADGTRTLTIRDSQHEYIYREAR